MRRVPRVRATTGATQGHECTCREGASGGSHLEAAGWHHVVLRTVELAHHAHLRPPAHTCGPCTETHIKRKDEVSGIIFSVGD